MKKFIVGAFILVFVFILTILCVVDGEIVHPKTFVFLSNVSVGLAVVFIVLLAIYISRKIKMRKNHDKHN